MRNESEEAESHHDSHRQPGASRVREQWEYIIGRIECSGHLQTAPYRPGTVVLPGPHRRYVFPDRRSGSGGQRDGDPGGMVPGQFATLRLQRRGIH